MDCRWPDVAAVCLTVPCECFQPCSEVPAMKLLHTLRQTSLDRRSFLTKALSAAGAYTIGAIQLAAADAPTKPGAVDDYLKEIEDNERKLRSKDAKPMIGVGDK